MNIPLSPEDTLKLRTSDGIKRETPYRSVVHKVFIILRRIGYPLCD